MTVVSLERVAEVTSGGQVAEGAGRGVFRKPRLFFPDPTPQPVSSGQWPGGVRRPAASSCSADLRVPRTVTGPVTGAWFGDTVAGQALARLGRDTEKAALAPIAAELLGKV